MHRLIRHVAAIKQHRRWFEAGQGLGEYAIILALVAILAIGATSYLGGQINGTLSKVGDRIQGSVLADSGGGPGPQTTSQPTSQPTPQPTAKPTPTPATAYKTKKTCVAAGYAWITKPKPARPA